MHQLESYSKLRARCMADADALHASFFYFSPLNVLPKLALGKLVLARIGEDGAALVSPDGTARILPYGTRADYYRMTLDALTRFSALALVPEWLAKHINKSYKVSRQHTEYLIETQVIGQLGGKRFKRMRNDRNGAAAACTVHEFTPADAADYLALNQTWYRQSAPTKFRTYDKTCIDWLIQNWEPLQSFAPDAALLGVRATGTGRWLSMHAGCQLTASMWTAYTERYDKSADIRGANLLGFGNLATRFTAPVENDGTADSAAIRQAKDRYGTPSLAAYMVKRK